MATFTLIKANSSDIWIHNDGTDDLIISLGYFRMVDDKFELYSESGGQLREALLTDIIVRDDSTGGGDETFTTSLQLVTRLKALSYPYFPSNSSGGSGAVDSVFGRTGVVVAQPADYNASQITNDSAVFGTNVDDALNYLASINSSAWANFTGIWANITGVLTLGDINDDGNGTKVIIRDSAQQIELKGDLVLEDKTSGFEATFNTSSLDANYTYTLPPKSGTFAMLSDISGGANTIYSSDNVLVSDRTVSLGGYKLSFIESSGSDITAFRIGSQDISIFYQNSGGSQLGFLLNPTSMIIKDEINAIGLQYAADYSANFTERSLVDKGYVDSVASSLTLTGDVTGSGSGSIATTISNGVVSVAMMSAGGTPSATTFLRGDNTWATPSATSVLNTDGDILYYNSGDDRLPIGSEGQVLIVSSGLPIWSTISFGDYSEWAEYSGTRASGDLLLKLGDYDDTGDGTRIEIDQTGSINFYFENQLRHAFESDGVRFDNTITIRKPGTAIDASLSINNLTNLRTYQFSDASGTIALVGDNDRLSSATPSSGTLNVDWSDAETWDFAISEATTLSETNAPSSNETKVITLYVTGNFALTFPTGWDTNIIGSYDGTKLNQIVVEYRSSGNYFTTINQPD